MLKVTSFACLRKLSHTAFTNSNWPIIWGMIWGFNVVLHQSLHKSYSCYIIAFLPGERDGEKQLWVTTFSPDDFLSVFVSIALETTS